ncbi:hypothetical protein [Pseudomonas sp. OIL-1]|uniref:hypothetical protein n=1 Tax=Pseudomonas sp. OIL-1 TaxID=2706126 RepID=UPI0013A713CA|nr:hypothetical protein [Pseudomonas sp. OIL-1]QIB50193.1 hypothetical protein G3M63_03385 [Pseudomonas sp. OIL-1]
MSLQMGVRTLTILVVVVLGFFALGSWMAEQNAPGEMQWHGEYQASLWQPLQQQTLTLAGVDAALGTGSLWLINAENQPLLVSRHPLESDGLNWRVQAVIELDSAQTDSLVRAQAWTVDSPEQSISPGVAAPLAGRLIKRISLIPEEPVDVVRFQGSLGNPAMRMDVGDGRQAWVYPEQGAVVAVSEDQAHSILFGPSDDYE